jgi:hypothetical protein
MLVCGAPIDGERHVYWHFVSSSKARLAQAKADWREGRFAKVWDDEVDRVRCPRPDACARRARGATLSR